MKNGRYSIFFFLLVVTFVVIGCANQDPPPPDMVTEKKGVVVDNNTNTGTDADGDRYDVCVNGNINGCDCNDSNANVNPGHAEIPGNGIDDNCNGSVDENNDNNNNNTGDGPDGEPCGVYNLVAGAKTIRLEWTDPRGSTYVNDKVILMGDLLGCWSPAIRTWTSTGSVVFEAKLNPGSYIFNIEFDDVTAGDDGWSCNNTNSWDSTKMKAFADGSVITISPKSNGQGGCNLGISF